MRGINKEIEYLNNTINQTGIYRTSQPTPAEHTFFSSACTTFPSTDHMLALNRPLYFFKKLKSCTVYFLTMMELNYIS